MRSLRKLNPMPQTRLLPTGSCRAPLIQFSCYVTCFTHVAWHLALPWRTTTNQSRVAAASWRLGLWRPVLENWSTYICSKVCGTPESNKRRWCSNSVWSCPKKAHDHYVVFASYLQEDDQGSFNLFISVYSFWLLLLEVNRGVTKSHWFHLKVSIFELIVKKGNALLKIRTFSSNSHYQPNRLVFLEFASLNYWMIL